MNWLFKLLDWWKSYRLDVIAAKAAATNRPYEAVLEVAKGQSEFMNKWLDGFKITDINTTTTVVRDEDEWREEQERERNSSITLDGGVQESIRNVLKAGAFKPLEDLID